MSDVNSRLVFMHIPKTGGTSLHEVLVAQFKPEEICPERFNHLREWASSDLAKFRLFSGHFDIDSINNIPGRKRIVTLFREPKSRIISLYYFWRSHKYSVIEKNNLHGPRLAKKFSLLEFLRYSGGAIPENIDNVMTRTLLGKTYIGQNREYLYPKNEVFDHAKRAVDSLSCLGIMDTFEDSLRHITAHLGFKFPDRVPHAKSSQEAFSHPDLEPVQQEQITPEISEELERLTEMDSKVCAYARERFESQRNQC